MTPFDTPLRLVAVLMMVLGLAACTGTDSTLGLAGSDGQSDAPQVADLPPPPEGGANVYFAPIVGAPVDKVTALSRRLSAEAETANIRLSPGRASTLTYEVKGYFSALNEGGTTTIIHVWDIFTPDGQRVHRIQGQEAVATPDAPANDPWAAIPPATMEQIANSFLADYQRWRASIS
jgi:hypothetical protein